MCPHREKERFSPFVKSIAALLCLLVTQNNSSPFAGETTMTAVELLTVFSGESAKQYEPFFRFSEETRIVRVEIHAVATESTTARYSGREEAWKEVNNILRIRTADGFEGISGVDSYYQEQFSDEHLLELKDAAAELIALQSLDPVEVGIMLKQMRPDLGDAVRSSIDIAFWDLAARKADRPLYELLGAKRHSMEPYASLPFYDSLPEYVEAVSEYAKLGYTTFKFHVWGLIEEDVRLVELVQQTFGDAPYRFMIDLEGAYDLEDALRLGRQSLGCSGPDVIGVGEGLGVDHLQIPLDHRVVALVEVRPRQWVTPSRRGDRRVLDIEHKGHEDLSAKRPM